MLKNPLELYSIGYSRRMKLWLATHRMTGMRFVAKTRQEVVELILLQTKASCPKCKHLMITNGTTFIERGSWDGKQFSGEGDYPSYICKSCDIEVIIADRLK